MGQELERSARATQIARFGRSARDQGDDWGRPYRVGARLLSAYYVVSAPSVVGVHGRMKYVARIFYTGHTVPRARGPAALKYDCDVVDEPAAQISSTVPSFATTYTLILSIARTSRLTRSAALRAEGAPPAHNVAHPLLGLSFAEADRSRCRRPGRASLWCP